MATSDFQRSVLREAGDRKEFDSDHGTAASDKYGAKPRQAETRCI
jgi:hypothetical protein